MRPVSLNGEQFEELSSAVLGQGGVLHFRARGSSMYPFLRSGDILTVVPVEPAALQPGSVAFYRNQQNKLVAHRVIQVDCCNGKVSLIIRGDALTGPAEMVAGEQVLGQVVTVRRRSKTFHIDQGYHGQMARMFAKGPPIGAWLLKAGEIGTRAVLPVLTRLQSLSLYRAFTRWLIGRSVSYRLATRNDSIALYEFSGMLAQATNGILDEASAKPYEHPQANEYTLVACLGDKIAGMVVVNHFPDNEGVFTGWWIWGMLVRTRYRGAGIGEGLIRLALQKTAEAGAASLNLLVFEHNQAAIGLYTKMGFRPAAHPALDIELEKEVEMGSSRRVFLSYRY